MLKFLTSTGEGLLSLLHELLGRLGGFVMTGTNKDVGGEYR